MKAVHANVTGYQIGQLGSPARDCGRDRAKGGFPVFFDEDIELRLKGEEWEVDCVLTGTCHLSGNEYEWDTDLKVTRKDTGADVTHLVANLEKGLDTLLAKAVI